MNLKTNKRKSTKCIVPTCSFNKPNPPPNPKTQVPNPPNWSEISGEIKLFYNPILQRQYSSNTDQVKLMICENHLNYQELIKNFETKLEKSSIDSDFTEVIDKVIQETCKNYDILNVLNCIFDPLMSRLSKLSKRKVDQLSKDEIELLIKLLEFFKILTRSINNRSVLCDLGLVDILVSMIETNELKSSKDDENKVKVVALCMLIFTSFCTVNEQKIGNHPQRVYKATWSYLSMDVPELQHQTFAFLWALLNHDDSSYRQKIRKEIMFLVTRFNEYKEQWSTRTLELAIMFLASAIFNENKELFTRIDQEDKNNLKECVDYLEDSKISLSDKGKYFAERIIGSIQPFIIERAQDLEENID